MGSIHLAVTQITGSAIKQIRRDDKDGCWPNGGRIAEVDDLTIYFRQPEGLHLTGNGVGRTTSKVMGTKLEAQRYRRNVPRLHVVVPYLALWKHVEYNQA